MWLAVCPSALRAAAADAEVVPYDETLKSHRGEVEAMLHEGKIPAGKEQVFDDYITKYQLPQFVLRSNGNDLRVIRDTFRRKLFMPAPPGAARQRLLELTLEGFKKILTDPALGKSFVGDDKGKWTAWTAAKCNVIMTLGDLNESETTPTARAKPFPEALPILLEIAKPPAAGAKVTGREGRDDSLRVAALNALEHHAENQAAPAETRSKIRDVMLAIVEQRKPPAGRDPAVNDYLRARAAEVLAQLKDVGPRNQVVTALDRIVSNPAESARLRCHAAKALGGLTFSSNSNVDFKPLADHVGRLAVDVFKMEVDRAAKKEPPLQSFDLDARRRLKAAIRLALDGMSGLFAGATDSGQRDFVKKVSDKVKNVDGVLDKDVNGEVATAKLLPAVKDLESMLVPREVAPDEKPAEEAEALAGSPPSGAGTK
jgi:hypothetical protein